MKKNIYIGFCLLVALSLIGASKSDIFTHLKDALRSYNKDYPSEKIYIQTDKTYYKPSESVWYKGFLVNATDNKPSATSDVLYVELQDPWGNAVETHEQKVNSGTFNGMFSISADKAGGIYKIVAYTRWMKNWGKDYFFSKEITLQKVITPRLLLKLDFEKRAYGAGDEVVANLNITDLNNNKTTGSVAKATIRLSGKEYKSLEAKSADGQAVIRFNLPDNLDTADGILQIVVKDKGVEESISRSIPLVLNEIHLQFFPEGGELVAGTENKVAFEALNEFGKGADVSGEVLDESGKVITTFSSFHLGMGAFSFTPLEEKKYFARIVTPVGNNELRKLPEVKSKGYSLSLISKDDKQTTWKVFSHTDNNDMSIIAHTQGVIQASEKITIRKGVNTVKIGTKDFPMGIAVFTLFDGNEAIAERLIFMNEDKRLHINITTDKEYYAPKERVKLSIETTDENGNAAPANIGLAVVDEQILTMADDKQDNLLSYMLLSSELKGKIQEPSFYFDPDEPKAKEAIDYLLLTHGWRRFQWNDILEGKAPIKIQSFAERLGSVYGYILNGENSTPVQADVFMIELGGKRRIAKLKTTKEGHFVFHNVDISNGIFVSTKLPNKVILLEGTPIIAKDDSVIDTEEGGIVDLSKKTDDVKKPMEVKSMDGYTMIDDFEGVSNALEESVVIGYGTQRKHSLSGAVSIVSRSYDIMPLGITNDIISGLEGRVAGIAISPKGGSSGGNQNIRIRGISSLSTTEPLVIIDGIPVEGQLTEALNLLNPNDIESISVLKESASAIYGSRASNGIIVLNTKKGGFQSKYKSPKPKYSGVPISRRLFYRSPVFCQETDNASQDNLTVYWNANIITDEKGKAEVSFKNNTTSSTFRITAEGVSTDGLLTTKTKRIVTQESFSVDAKVPIFAGSGDRMKIPVMLKNTTDKLLIANLYVDADMPMPTSIVADVVRRNIEILPNTTKTIYIPIDAGTIARDMTVNIRAEANGLIRTISRTISVREINFPYHFSFSGRNMNGSTVFNLPDYIKGTLRAEACANVQLLDELNDGVESIFREPYGCFEQLLSSALPNVFALQFIEVTGKSNDKVRKNAVEYIVRGYEKMANYEVKKTGGFEWYGGSPAHEMLTAYGLVYFHEMRKVSDKVNPKMVDRALEYLLSRRNKKGGFHQNRGKYGFSGAPVNVNNAYIVYALHHIGKGNLIDEEYQATLQEALKSKDIYRMALLASAAFDRGDVASYKQLIALFEKATDKMEFSQIKFEDTVVRSYGEARNREAIGYWLLALSKDKEYLDSKLADKCVKYISEGKRGGSFGNTQATSVCLQALTKYSIGLNSSSSKGTFCLNINNDETCVDIRGEENSQYAPKSSIKFVDKLKSGKNNITVSYQGIENPYPYNINISWYSSIPASSDQCPLHLSMDLKTSEIRVNETVRLSVKLKNKENTAKPMSVAIIGIPGGMSLQPWQLKELQEKEVFDFYEIINDNLVIYYRELAPNEEKVINLDLKAEIAGKYTGIASSAYIYYMNEHKHWIKGLGVDINE